MGAGNGAGNGSIILMQLVVVVVIHNIIYLMNLNFSNKFLFLQTIFIFIISNNFIEVLIIFSNKI